MEGEGERWRERERGRESERQSERAHSEVTKVFHFLFTSLAHFMSRQLFEVDVISAQDTLVFFSNLCQYRVFLTTASCEAFDDGPAQVLVSGILRFFRIFPTFPILTPSITMLLNFLTFANSPRFTPPGATFSTLSLLICSATHLLFVTTLILNNRCISADHLVAASSCFHFFQIADFWFRTMTATHRSSI